jgi:hypothetical protein
MGRSASAGAVAREKELSPDANMVQSLDQGSITATLAALRGLVLYLCTTPTVLFPSLQKQSILLLASTSSRTSDSFGWRDISLDAARMDPLSTTASLIAVLQLSSDVVKYIIGAAGTSKERRRLREEVLACEFVLLQLQNRSDDVDEERQTEKFVAPTGVNTPLHRLERALSEVKAKLEPKYRLNKAISALMTVNKKFDNGTPDQQYIDFY